MIRVWWHCLLKLLTLDFNHRMCSVAETVRGRVTGKILSNKKEWFCECGYQKSEWAKGVLQYADNVTGAK